MSRKHFEALAKALRRVRPNKDTNPAGYRAWQDCESAVSNVLSAFSPTFNMQTWDNAVNLLPPLPKEDK